ncbi:hypothetical protein DY468_15255 [Rhodopseudomonas sp. BR0M22]|nr:hypothetical protein [Rhodopseudomonas sp. BR0M22]
MILLEPINALRAEALVDALDDAATIAIPCSASSAFDPVKTRLEAHGTIGVDGADAPHQLWWGGRRPPAAPTGIYRPDGIVVTTCYLHGTQSGEALLRLQAEADLFGLKPIVQELPQTPVGYVASKIAFIMEQLDRTTRPLLWIAPDVAVKQHPVLLQALNFDVAFHRRKDGVADPRVMAFRPTEATRALLRVWQRLSFDFPDLPESFVFDQAWILTTAQQPLETSWLPGSYCEADSTIRSATFRVPPPVFDIDTALCSGSYPRIARRFGRPHAPEPALIIKGRNPQRHPVMVVITGHRDAAPGKVSTAFQAIASAFAADCGGFAQLELVLCEETAEMRQLMANYDDGWVVPAAADGHFPPDTFVRLGRRAALADAAGSLDIAAPSPVTNIVSAAMSAQARWSQHGLGPFIRRPHHATIHRSSGT